MNIKKSIIIFAILAFLVVPVFLSSGCTEDVDVPFLPYTSKTSEILVPDMPIDVFIYAKQHRPTTIPAEIAGTDHNIDVESLTLWGVPAERDFSFGAALRFSSMDIAEEVNAQIQLNSGYWKMISGQTVFIVRGTGAASKALRTAIEQQNFGLYTDVQVLEAVQTLPNGSRAKMVAVGIAKPTSALMDAIKKSLKPADYDRLTKVVKAADAQLIAGGLYSMYRLDIDGVMSMLNGGGSFENLDTGFLFMAKSGLPSFMFQPIVRNYLTENKFIETNKGEYPIYKGSWEIADAGKLHIMLRVEDSYIYAAVAGKESYAETLITNIRR